MWKSIRGYNYNILSPCPKVLYQNNTCTLKQYMSYNAFLCSCSCWITLSRVNRGILPVARQHTRPAQWVDGLKWGLTLLTRAFVYVRKSPPRSPLWTGLAHGCSMWLRETQTELQANKPSQLHTFIQQHELNTNFQSQCRSWKKVSSTMRF